MLITQFDNSSSSLFFYSFHCSTDIQIIPIRLIHAIQNTHDSVILFRSTVGLPHAN